MPEMTIGTVARRAGVHVETLRYYERRGLLPEPPRTESNYRLYSEEAVRRVRFIKRAQELGFSLREIQDLLSFRAEPGTQNSAIREKVAAKIADIDGKLRSLEVMRAALTALLDECPGRGPAAECPILEAIEPDDVGRPSRVQ